MVKEKEIKKGTLMNHNSKTELDALKAKREIVKKILVSWSPNSNHFEKLKEVSQTFRSG